MMWFNSVRERKVARWQPISSQLWPVPLWPGPCTRPRWITDRVNRGKHAVRLVLIGQVGHVDRAEVGNVVHFLLAGQRGERVPQGIEPLADVRVHVDVNATHLPQDVQCPGARAAALCRPTGRMTSCKKADTRTHTHHRHV